MITDPTSGAWIYQYIADVLNSTGGNDIRIRVTREQAEYIKAAVFLAQDNENE